MKENRTALALSLIFTVTFHIILTYFVFFFRPYFQPTSRKQIFTVSIVLNPIKTKPVKKGKPKTLRKKVSSKTVARKEIKVGKKTVKRRKVKRKKKAEEEILKKKLAKIREEAYLEKALEKLRKQEKESAEEGVNVKITGSNIVDPLLSLYLARLTERIRLNWSLPQPKKGLETIVDIKISKDGRALKIEIEKSSGDYLFDKWALDAVKKSFPFDPLPSTYTKGYLEIGVRFKQ